MLLSSYLFFVSDKRNLWAIFLSNMFSRGLRLKYPFCAIGAPTLSPSHFSPTLPLSSFTQVHHRYITHKVPRDGRGPGPDVFGPGGPILVHHGAALPRARAGVRERHRYRNRHNLTPFAVTFLLRFWAPCRLIRFIFFCPRSDQGFTKARLSKILRV